MGPLYIELLRYERQIDSMDLSGDAGGTPEIRDSTSLLEVTSEAAAHDPRRTPVI